VEAAGAPCGTHGAPAEPGLDRLQLRRREPSDRSRIRDLAGPGRRLAGGAPVACGELGLGQAAQRPHQFDVPPPGLGKLDRAAQVAPGEGQVARAVSETAGHEPEPGDRRSGGIPPRVLQGVGPRPDLDTDLPRCPELAHVEEVQGQEPGGLEQRGRRQQGSRGSSPGVGEQGDRVVVLLAAHERARHRSTRQHVAGTLGIRLELHRTASLGEGGGAEVALLVAVGGSHRQRAGAGAEPPVDGHRTVVEHGLGSVTPVPHPVEPTAQHGGVREHHADLGVGRPSG
jgi:hypothetical protein